MKAFDGEQAGANCQREGLFTLLNGQPECIPLRFAAKNARNI